MSASLETKVSLLDEHIYKPTPNFGIYQKQTKKKKEKKYCTHTLPPGITDSKVLLYFNKILESIQKD